MTKTLMAATCLLILQFGTMRAQVELKAIEGEWSDLKKRIAICGLEDDSFCGFFLTRIEQNVHHHPWPDVGIYQGGSEFWGQVVEGEEGSAMVLRYFQSSLTRSATHEIEEFLWSEAGELLMYRIRWGLTGEEPETEVYYFLPNKPLAIKEGKSGPLTAEDAERLRAQAAGLQEAYEALQR